MKRRKGSERNEEARENVRGMKRKIRRPKLDPVKQREALQAHFAKRFERLKPRATTRTPTGQILDWIDIRSQVKGGRIATPPPPLRPMASQGLRRNEKPYTFELEDTRVKRGPEGTVPVVRRNLRALPKGRSVEEFLFKHGRRSYPTRVNPELALEMPGSGSDHLYAFTGQSVTCYGGEGVLNIYDPYTNWSDEFSLHQIALSRGDGTDLQTVEAGWQEYRDLYGDWVPHLFVFYTTNGYSSSGDNRGGYNRDVDGWVQYSRSIYPEAKFTNHSTRGGTQYVFKIKYQLWNGNWWLAVQDEWIGYYPASLFDSAGLRSKADQCAFYGEVTDSASHSGDTHTDMGSGYYPDYGWGWSSYQRSLKYQSSTGGSMSTYDASWTFVSDPDLYDLITHMRSGGSWGSYFWLGGPGAG